MAKAFATTQTFEVRTDGTVYLTMNMTFVDEGRTDQGDAVAVFNMSDAGMTVDDVIREAVRSKANELGYTLEWGDILYPAFTRV